MFSDPGYQLPYSGNPFRHIVRPELDELKGRVRFDYRCTAQLMEHQLEKGERATDEAFIEAVGWFHPPLLEKQQLDDVIRELDPSANRAGRPPVRRPDLSQIADVIEKLERDDLPPRFRAALCARIRSRKRMRYVDVYPQNPWKRYRRDRDMIIRHIYRNLTSSLDGVDSVDIPFIGKIEVPERGRLSPSMHKMTVVQTALRDHLKFGPISLGTMMNIVSR